MVSLVKASINDADQIFNMQISSFKPLLDRYQDFDTNPATETIDKIINRLKLSNVDYFLIKFDVNIVGAVRIVKLDNNVFRVGQIFVIPRFQGRGIAQEVFKIIFNKYKNANSWELDTILEERGNCYLYEKLGFVKTNNVYKINDKMTIVHYVKNK